MYDLLNTQARLSRQKEHLQLPTRHALHPGTWLFRVLCVKRYWVFLVLTETLGSWGGSELAGGVQSIAEVLSTWEMGTKLCVMPFFSWEPQEKWFQLFPCYLGAALTILLCPRCSLAVWCGQEVSHELLCAQGCHCRVISWCYAVICSFLPVGPISSFSCELLLCQCPVHEHAVDKAGGVVMEHPDIGGFPPEAWQRRAAVCVSCPSPNLCSSVRLLRMSLRCM